MGLSDKAMIVTLSVSQWTARKLDKRATQEVADNHNTTTDWGRYNKVLIAEESIKRVAKVVTECRTYHYQNTLPWSDNGARLLPAANYFEYIQAMNRHGDQFRAAVSELVDNYPSLREQARAHLNGLYNDRDYPSVTELERRYSFSVDVSPLPDAGDFRVSLGDAEVSAIKADIEQRADKATKEAMRDLWGRLHAAVQHMADTLSAERDGGKAPIFRDSLVGNLVDLCGLLPRLNVTGDANLEAMRQRVEESLTAVTPQHLREDKAARNNVAINATDILSAMAGFMGGDQ